MHRRVSATSSKASMGLSLARPRRVRTIHCGCLSALAAALDRALDALDETPVHLLKLSTRPVATLRVGRRRISDPGFMSQSTISVIVAKQRAAHARSPMIIGAEPNAEIERGLDGVRLCPRARIL
jgi:hypothetical protein